MMKAGVGSEYRESVQRFLLCVDPELVGKSLPEPKLIVSIEPTEVLAIDRQNPPSLFALRPIEQTGGAVTTDDFKRAQPESVFENPIDGTKYLRLGAGVTFTDAEGNCFSSVWVADGVILITEDMDAPHPMTEDEQYFFSDAESESEPPRPMCSRGKGEPDKTLNKSLSNLNWTKKQQKPQLSERGRNVSTRSTCDTTNTEAESIDASLRKSFRNVRWSRNQETNRSTNARMRVSGRTPRVQPPRRFASSTREEIEAMTRARRRGTFKERASSCDSTSLCSKSPVILESRSSFTKLSEYRDDLISNLSWAPNLEGKLKAAGVKSPATSTVEVGYPERAVQVQCRPHYSEETTAKRTLHLQHKATSATNDQEGAQRKVGTNFVTNVTVTNPINEFSLTPQVALVSSNPGELRPTLSSEFSLSATTVAAGLPREGARPVPSSHSPSATKYPVRTTTVAAGLPREGARPVPSSHSPSATKYPVRTTTLAAGLPRERSRPVPPMLRRPMAPLSTSESSLNIPAAVQSRGRNLYDRTSESSYLPHAPLDFRGPGSAMGDGLESVLSEINLKCVRPDRKTKNGGRFGGCCGRTRLPRVPSQDVLSEGLLEAIEFGEISTFREENGYTSVSGSVVRDLLIGV